MHSPSRRRADGDRGAVMNCMDRQTERPIEELRTFSKRPDGPDQDRLKYDPASEAMRSDERFGEIVEAAKHPNRQVALVTQ